MQGITGLGYEVQYQPLVPSGGINNYQKAAELLKEFGRNGDTYIVHAAEGETMLPMEVLEQNPRLKKMIWKQLADMGVDPERYVVGNKLNSINPVTGQPEFFFKSVFRAAKKAVKSVAKVAKAVAPVALAVAAPVFLPALPVAASVGLGSLAGGLVQGQSFGDALKNAAISGGLAGVGNMAFRGGSFFGSPVSPKAGLGSLSAKSFRFANPFAPTAPIGMTPSTATKLAGTENIFKTPGVSDYFKNAGDLVKGAGEASNVSFFDTLSSKAGDFTDTIKDFYGDYISPSRASIQPTGVELGNEAARIANQQIQTAQAVNNQLTQAGLQPPPIDIAGIQADAIKTAQANLAPGMVTKYGPAVGAGILGLNVADAATGGAIFGMPEQEGIANQQLETGFDLYKANPTQYGFGSGFYGSNPFYQDPRFLSPRRVAEGGEIVGPGTGTSDSVPAMLSDGEFVMTARAVEGAGGGNRSEGAKKMYAMMRKLESRSA